jgi:hypothetical protein
LRLLSSGSRLPQSSLIKTLATEVKLCEAFEEKAYTYVVEFHEFCFKTLPQSIILTVLKYLGVPDVNIDFFTRFLTENLDIGPGRLVTRAAGVPEHHGAMQLFFTESIFFFLELAVYKSTGMCLYRIHNTCYFVGTANEALQARKEIDNFGGVTNLSFDVYPGDLHIGFLKLIRRPSLPSILALHDPDLVTNYAHSVLRRLNKCTTILDWILVWSRTAGTYAAHLFGPLAHILGATHLATVKKAYVRLFAILFPNSSLTAHLRQMLQSHFPSWYNFPVDVPLEPLIYLPQAYGGLGVKNPFITLVLANGVRTDADAMLAQHTNTPESDESSLADTYGLLLHEPGTCDPPRARMTCGCCSCMQRRALRHLAGWRCGVASGCRWRRCGGRGA